MTAYVITVPGTFLRTLDADSRAALLRGLRPRTRSTRLWVRPRTWTC